MAHRDKNGSLSPHPGHIPARLLALMIAFSACTACAANTVSPASIPESPAPAVETGAPSAYENTENSTPSPTPEENQTSFAEDLSAADIVADMGRGWNLGNTLDSTSKNALFPKEQEVAWGNPVTTEDMIKLLADTGFKTLRIPTTWSKFIGAGPDYTVSKLMLERLQEIVDWGIRYDLYVIINLHHDGWYMPNEESRSEAEARLEKVWGQIALYFAEYSEKLIFETMNEPRVRGSHTEWSGGMAEEREILNQYNKIAVEAIRATGGHNEKRFIMIPTYAASAENAAAEGFVVLEDDRVIISLHAYIPYSFSLDTVGTNKWSAENRSDTNSIDNLFVRIYDNFLSKGYAVVMGEFGAMNKENIEARVAWLSFYLKTADQYGVPCIWWDNGVTTGSGERFGLMDRRALEWIFPELIETMFK